MGRRESLDLARVEAVNFMTVRQLEILQHSLGVDQYGQGQMYRNHFCAGGGDEHTCRELVEMGYMATFTRSYLPYYNCTVTEAGKAAMMAESPKPPKLTRSQKRYREFLDADTGRSFIEWLKDRAEYAKEQKMGAWGL
jgi:hypothetical protein